MVVPPAGISEADWSSWPAGARQLILVQPQEIEQLRNQLTALATELASLRERIGRSSRNSSKPPSIDGPGFKPPERRKGSGRNAAASRAIQDSGRSRCRSSGWMRWWSTTPMPAAAAARCWLEKIQTPCTIRWSRFRQSRRW
jgi:hypothetical protein